MSERWAVMACALWSAVMLGVAGCGTTSVPGNAASDAAADAASDAAPREFACGTMGRCTVGTQVCRLPNRPSQCPAMPTPDTCRAGCPGCAALPEPTCVSVPATCTATPTCDCITMAACGAAPPGQNHTCTTDTGGPTLRCAQNF